MRRTVRIVFIVVKICLGNDKPHPDTEPHMRHGVSLISEELNGTKQRPRAEPARAWTASRQPTENTVNRVALRHREQPPRATSPMWARAPRPQSKRRTTHLPQYREPPPRRAAARSANRSTKPCEPGPDHPHRDNRNARQMAHCSRKTGRKGRSDSRPAAKRPERGIRSRSSAIWTAEYFSRTHHKLGGTS